MPTLMYEHYIVYTVYRSEKTLTEAKEAWLYIHLIFHTHNNHSFTHAHTFTHLPINTHRPRVHNQIASNL